MRQTSGWAFWRRLQYGAGFSVVVFLIFGFLYQQYLYQPPNCFDGLLNGDETGIDCGGGCALVCSADVLPLRVNWAQSFEVRAGQYNVVAYVENRNPGIVATEVPYKISLYDNSGLIIEDSGITMVPPDSVYPIFVGPLQVNGRVPTNTFLELGNTIKWYPSEQGRDQFSVTNRSLSDIDTRPRLEARLVNNSLTEVSDVEVVATIFDINGNALTASRSFVERFSPRSEETVVFTWPRPIAKTLRSCEVPIDLVMAIDLSGSMNNDQADPPEPITSVKDAAQAFVSRLKTEDRVAVVTFATEAVLENSFGQVASSVAANLASLDIAPEEETGSTNTGAALQLAATEFGSTTNSAESRQVVILLTDGLATAPDENPEEFALSQAQNLKLKGIEIYTIGLGQEVNMDFLTQIASQPETAFQAIGRTEISQIYETITESICEDGPAVIDIIPKISKMQ